PQERFFAMDFAQPPNPFFHRVQIVAERSSLAHFSLDDMHATRLPLLILIATFVFAFQLEGADTAIVSVGGTSIVLPIPEGFFRYDGKSTKVDRLHQGLLPASNRMLAEFCSEESLAEVLLDRFPKIERRFNAQAERSLETLSVTPELFNEIKPELRKSMAVSESYRDVIKELERNTASAVATQFNLPMTMKVGEMIPLGIFDETDESVCFSVLGKVHVPTLPDDYVSITAGCILRVRGRVFYLFSSSPYHDKSDIAWARRSLQNWRDAVLKSNAR
ncbi:MAG: hypothetical protein DME33_15370, partial [Verrucomicrobia bacterium]